MTTTIKVSTEVRDRLKEQASAEGHTLGEHLAYLADLADTERQFEQLRDAIAATSPEDMASYRAESAAWDRLEYGPAE